MHSETALFNDPFNLGQTVLSSIIQLKGATGNETLIEDRKNNRLEDGLVAEIERAIYEDTRRA